MEGLFPIRFLKRIILPAALMLVAGFFHYAQAQNQQDYPSATQRQLLRAADTSFAHQEYDNYLQFIRQVFPQWLNDEEHTLKTGIACYYSRLFAEAALTLRKIPTNSTHYTEALYYLALVDKTKGQYDEAIKKLSPFLLKEKVEPKDNIISKFPLEITNLKAAKKMQQEPAKGTVRRLSYTINTEGSEFAPVAIDSLHLYYTTLNNDSVQNIELGNFEFTTGRIKQAIIQFDDYTTDGELPGLQHDFTNFINGNCEDSGKVLFFTKLIPFKENYRHLICQATFSGTKYRNIKKLPSVINLKGYKNSQPFITKMKINNKWTRVLFFSSNRPKGYGGHDIWYAPYDSAQKQWLDAINCGATVNSAGNEITPSFDPLRQLLFFSSDAKQGLGGYDIFGSNWETTFFNYAENLGHPVNSSYDESYFSVNPGKYSGFFCSNRPRPDEANSNTEDIFEAYLPNTRGIVVERPIAGYNGYKAALTIYYATNNDIPDAKSLKSLDSMITTASFYRNKHLVVKGHTDNVGSVAFNEALSKRRVNYILKLLKAGKIDAYRIQSAAMDMRDPRVPYTNLKGAELEQARAFNRRVEIYLISK